MVSSGIGALGSLFSGVTNYFGQMAEAQEDENNAITALRQAGVNSQVALQEGNATAAEGAVRAAANGGGLVGSALGVISNLSNQAMYNARQQVYRGQTQAQNYTYAASVAKFNAIAGAIGGGIKAGTSLAGGYMEDALLKQQNIALQALRGSAGGSYGAGDTEVPY